MDRAYIHWDPNVMRLAEVPSSRHPLLRGKGYYAIVAATLDQANDVWHSLELMFIGKSFEQGLGARIAQSTPAHDRATEMLTTGAGRELIVMLGDQTDATLRRVTRGFTDDVHRCLVVRHEPPCNLAFTDTYLGRKISVINRGDFEPLKPKCLLRPVPGDSN